VNHSLKNSRKTSSNLFTPLQSLHHLLPLKTSSPPLQNLFTTSSPPLHHLFTTSSPPLRHLFTTSSPPLQTYSEVRDLKRFEEV
jgi:hypothetical protein